MSTFTHIGRHRQALRDLRRCVTPGPGGCRVALLGSGPVEPFLAASLLRQDPRQPPPDLWAVDQNADIIACLTTLLDGGAVPLPVLARLCRDDTDGDDAPLNHNFGPAVAASIAECLAAGIDPLLTVVGDSLTRASDVAPRVTPVHDDCRRFLERSAEGFDLLYLGLLLTNLRKVTPPLDLVALLRLARTRLRPGGVIGVGGSISPRHGVHRDLLDLAQAGFAVGYLALENVRLLDGTYFADYAVAAVPADSRRHATVTTPRPEVAASFATLREEPADSIAAVADRLATAAAAGDIVVAAIPTAGSRPAGAEPAGSGPAGAGPAGSWRVWSVRETELRSRVGAGQRLWLDAVHVTAAEGRR